MSKEKSSNDLINIEIYFDEFRRPSFMTVVSSKCRPLYPLPQRGHRTEGPRGHRTEASGLLERSGPLVLWSSAPGPLPLALPLVLVLCPWSSAPGPLVLCPWSAALGLLDRSVASVLTPLVHKTGPGPPVRGPWSIGQVLGLWSWAPGPGPLLGLRVSGTAEGGEWSS